jgi:3-oxoacyl-[acyl-carrier protein] reductase
MTELKRFADRVVMVTGAGHGIGHAVAERFAAEGARVVVNDLDQARANQVAAAIPGGRAIAVAADVSSKAHVDAMFDAAVAAFGTLDVLVNNAGNIHAARHFLESDEEWWDKLLDVNLKGAYLCAHTARPTSWSAKAPASSSTCRAAAPRAPIAAT